MCSWYGAQSITGQIHLYNFFRIHLNIILNRRCRDITARAWTKFPASSQRLLCVSNWEHGDDAKLGGYVSRLCNTEARACANFARVKVHALRAGAEVTMHCSLHPVTVILVASCVFLVRYRL